MLCKCIQYYLNQTYNHKELIIIDDSNKYIAGLNKKYILELNRNDVHYVHCAKNSIGTKRNRAIKLSKGDIICFWDDDDIHSPSRLEKQFSHMLKMKCDMSFLKNVPCLINNEIVKIPNKIHSNWWWKGYICPTMMFKRYLWEFCKFRNVSLSEDSLFIKDLTRQKIKLKVDVWYTDHVLFVYNVHANGVSKFYKYIITY
jgi:glycosyltransferase involved in cell wall biosynthesis